MPSAISRPSEPVDTVSISIGLLDLPSFMIEPLPKLRSIWRARHQGLSTCPWRNLQPDAGRLEPFRAPYDLRFGAPTNEGIFRCFPPISGLVPGLFNGATVHHLFLVRN